MRTVKKVLKILALVAGILLVVMVLLAGFTQTQFFRDRLRGAALSTLDSLLDADVQLGNLTGDLLRGFSIDHISIKVQNDFFLISRRVDLQYDLFQIPGKTISIDAIRIIKPEVNLLRGADGLWNFQRMLRPTPGDTTKGAPFDWVLRVNQFEIQEGRLTVVDSVSLLDESHPPMNRRSVDYHHFSLQQLNLVTSALLTPEEKRATITSLSFLCERPWFPLRNLSGVVVVTPHDAQVKDLHITTDRSDVRLNASMDRVNLLGEIDLATLRSALVRLSLDSHNLDLNELQVLLSPVDFLNGSVALDAEVQGQFGEMYVKRLDLAMGKTQLFLKGSVYNLHDPEHLALNVKCSESKIYSPDLLLLMPRFGLPDYESLGVTTLNLEFVGKPLDFATKFLFETQAGDVQGDLSMRIGGPSTLTYKGDILARRLNLAGVLGKQRLSSSVNGRVSLDGAGISFDRLVGEWRVRLDSSVFMGKAVSPSLITLNADERVVTGALRLRVGSTGADLSGRLDARNGRSPSFSVKGTVSSLNLEEVTSDPAYNSDLTMTVNASGSGVQWDRLNGDFLVTLSESRFLDYRVSSDSIHLALDQQDSLHKEFLFESTIADFSLRGAFDVEYLARLLPFEVANIQEAIAERLHRIDSTGEEPGQIGTLSVLREAIPATPTTLNATYVLVLKNLEPISAATGNRSFNGSGTFTGTIRGDVDQLSLDGRLSLGAFFYGTAESGVLVQDGTASFALNGLRPTDPLKDLEANLDLNARVMHIARTKLDSLHLTFRYQQEYASYTGNTNIGSDLRLAVQGLTSVSEDEAIFILNDLRVAYQDFAWVADGGGSVSFAKRGVRVQDLVMRRDTQTVTISGFLGNDGSLEGSVTGKYIDMDALKYLLSEKETQVVQAPFTGIADLTLLAGGSVSYPEYTASVHADNITFRTVPFGTLQATSKYRNKSLTATVELDSRAERTQGRPDLTINGTLPIDLAFNADTTDRLQEAPMNFSIRSDGIQMNILDPLVPTFNELSGILRCDLKVVGSPRNPNYQGNIRIDSCSFLFVPNNIVYLFEGSFRPQGDRIKVDEAIIRNVPEDSQFGREGLTRLTGDFALREFRPTDFNLTAHGQLLVVKETTLRSELSVYGNLFVEVGEQGLHFTGTIEHSLLKGSVYVRNSSLVFPPTQVQAAKQYSSTVPLLFVNDTVRVMETENQSVVSQYFGMASDTSAQATRLAPEVLPSHSFMDGMKYDLQITTEGGNTEFRMVFYNTPPEELVATINGKFTITGDGKKWYGDLRVDNAYYLFYNKRFDAQGTLRYTGDFLNPELDITATYQGTRVIVDTTSTDRGGAITERVVVTVTITGRRLEPTVTMSMTIDNEDYATYTKGPKSGDVQTDAISFIISGTFPLTKTEKNEVADNLGKTVGASLVTGATSLLSGALSEFVRRQTGFITSLELGQERWGESPDIRLSGVAAGGFWRYGGKINDPLNNISVSIQYSLGDVFDSPSLRNFMLELEQRRQEAASSVQNPASSVRSARLFYRISF
jgi:autotransporter translocation and assembly factor TamB